MRTIKLHHPTGHPYWQKNEFKVELPNGEFLDLLPFYDYDPKTTGYEIYVENGNVYFHECFCSSGGGKTKCRDLNPVLIVSKKDYDVLEYVGQELIMSAELKNDLKENELI